MKANFRTLDYDTFYVSNPQCFLVTLVNVSLPHNREDISAHWAMTHLIYVSNTQCFLVTPVNVSLPHCYMDTFLHTGPGHIYIYVFATLL